MPLKILIKLFNNSEQFRKNGVIVDHTEMSNPIEYILPFIKEEHIIVDNENEADAILASVLTVGYNEFCDYALKHSNKRIIAGGYHPSIAPEDFSKFKNVSVIVGGGESVINEAIEKGDMIYYGEQIDTIPFRTFFPNIVRYPNKKFISIRTFSGCNQNCGYCCHRLVYNKIKVFGLPNIIKDIEQQKPFGIFITDSDFLISPLFIPLVQYCKENNIFMRFYGSISSLREDKVELLNDSNFEIIVGLEKDCYEVEKIRLFNKLTIKKIGCIIRVNENQEFSNLKKEFNCDYYSEMYLMPFPKTAIGNEYDIPKCEYHKLNPKESWKLYKYKKKGK